MQIRFLYDVFRISYVNKQIKLVILKNFCVSYRKMRESYTIK